MFKSEVINIANLSKIDSRCEKCKHKDSCNNKRMVAYKLDEMPKINMKSATIPNNQPLTQPLSIKHTTITVKMGEYGTIHTSLEEVVENLNRKLYKGFNYV